MTSSVSTVRSEKNGNVPVMGALTDLSKLSLLSLFLLQLRLGCVQFRPPGKGKS